MRAINWAAAGLASVIAITVASPAGTRTVRGGGSPPSDLALTLNSLPIQLVPSREAALAELRPAAPKPAYAPGYSEVDALPAAGVVARFRINEPPGGAPPLVFVARDSATPPAPLAYSTFQQQPKAPIALARLPLAKPEVEWPNARPASATMTASAVLAYAPSGSEIEAPFAALLGAPAAEAAEDGAWLPRPRPDPQQVLSWLDGRALGQFAPGQHAWVQNPLPDSVFDAAQQKCLAEGIYFEARSESESGQAAVAQVILNRVRNPTYPKTICGVVYQNKNWRNRCQFSFACDGVKDRIRSQAAWRTAQRIAEDVTSGKIWLEDVGDSTHYYAYYVRPGWASRMIKVDRIGAHLFYRTKRGGWS